MRSDKLNRILMQAEWQEESLFFEAVLTVLGLLIPWAVLVLFFIKSL